MDFTLSPRCSELVAQLTTFMDERVIPAEAEYEAYLAEHGAHTQPPIMEALKAEARERGLWNLFHPDPQYGVGLSHAEYVPICEQLGRSTIGPEACNCNAPDTGNMELLSLFGTPEQQDRWLHPLLAGEIRSAFGMTEPDVASSDATNVRLRIDTDGDDYVLNGRKWWTTNALHPALAILIVMGKTAPAAAPHQQQSMVLVPVDTPGLTIVRGLHVFGYDHHEGHAELRFEDVRVPRANLLGDEGAGFAIAQTRLGPGRLHHCMRTLGAAERALELMCRRATERTTFGRTLAERDNVRDWIAESRIDIELMRTLAFKAAWSMDEYGNAAARTEVSALKVAVPAAALRIVDRAIQVHGGAGVSQDTPLAAMYAHLRTLRILDGPDEVHKMAIARHELKAYGL